MLNNAPTVRMWRVMVLTVSSMRVLERLFDRDKADPQGSVLLLLTRFHSPTYAPEEIEELMNHERHAFAVGEDNLAFAGVTEEGDPFIVPEHDGGTKV